MQCLVSCDGQMRSSTDSYPGCKKINSSCWRVGEREEGHGTRCCHRGLSCGRRCNQSLGKATQMALVPRRRRKTSERWAPALSSELAFCSWPGEIWLMKETWSTAFLSPHATSLLVSQHLIPPFHQISARG